MATGIGPSSSGSQATVASVVTSTLLAGLAFSGGVISAFPSSVWSSRAPTHNPTSAHQTTALTQSTKDQTTTSASAVMDSTAKDNSEAEGEDRENSKGQGEDREREGDDKDEEEENEEEKDKKKGRKASRGGGETERMDNSTAGNKPPTKAPEATAKENKETKSDLTKRLPGLENQLKYTHNPLDSNLNNTTEAANETAVFPASKDPEATLNPRTGGDKKHWPFSIHTGESTKIRKPYVYSRFVLILCRTRKMEYGELSL